MKKLAWILPFLLGSAFLGSCSSHSASEDTSTELRISAAASLQNALPQIIEAFEEENEGITVGPVNFDGSATLVEQIVGGDKVDVFASADMANMEKLQSEELVSGEPVVFATNMITLAVPAGNPSDVTDLSQVSDPAVKVAVCAPEVPCGAATQKLLELEGIDLEPVTQEQNVSAVAAKIASGEVDAGFIYQTDVLGSGASIEAVETPDLDPNLYPVAVVKGTDDAQAAELFVEFLVSAKAKEILAEFGFGAP